MFHRFKDYFQFSKAERVGVISLVIMIFLLIVIKQSLIYYSPAFSSEIQTFDSLSAQLNRLKQIEIEDKIRRDKAELAKIENFNPNTFEISDWQELGLSERQAQVIKNYQAKAGDFQSKRDVKKMFVISDALYAEISSHILLPDTVPKKETKKHYVKKWETKPRVYPKIKINSADTAEFKKLNGIGKALATRIVNYRNELGGFRSKEQLKEIWGIPEETLLRLDTQLILDVINIERINVNESSIEELKAHPYIRWKVANSIVKYRKQHGSYLQLEDLKESVLITDSIYDRIIPYLEL
ncbi:MAG: helix-hairpin-helix domain-containing protein [Flavobacteriales bacterium]|nr:helix-hairpin-helix domain-containing protein [Flavobacteriales bacterium]